jgi:hypothetical protein
MDSYSQYDHAAGDKHGQDLLTLLVKSKTRGKAVMHTTKAGETGAISLEKLTSMALEIGFGDLPNRVGPGHVWRVTGVVFY